MRKKFDLTTDKALIFSAIMILIFTIVMVVIFFMFQSVPDTLIVSFFGCFGLEGGYCAFIHKIKKEQKMRAGDITGFDDAEVLDEEDVIEEDDSELVINMTESEG